MAVGSAWLFVIPAGLLGIYAGGDWGQWSEIVIVYSLSGFPLSGVMLEGYFEKQE